ncbi:hypothetical protein GCM10018954_059140 [Kutzneria kofuensis]
MVPIRSVLTEMGVVPGVADMGTASRSRWKTQPELDTDVPRHRLLAQPLPTVEAAGRRDNAHTQNRFE